MTRRRANPDLIAPDGTTAALSHTKPLRTYRTLQFLASPIVRFAMRIRRENHRRIPKKGPVILAVNHNSVFDPVAVVVSIRRPLSALAKSYLFKSRFGHVFFGVLGGQIKVDRERRGNEAAVLAAVEALQAGRCVGVWPEGTRSWDGKLLRGKTGIARIALASGAPVYPIAVAGTERFFPKGAKFPRFGTRVSVKVGKPLDLSDLKGRENDRELCRQVTDRIMMEIARLLGQEDHYADLVRRNVEVGGLPLDAQPPEPPEGGDGGREGEEATAETGARAAGKRAASGRDAAPGGRKPADEATGPREETPVRTR